MLKHRKRRIIIYQNNRQTIFVLGQAQVTQCSFLHKEHSNAIQNEK